MIFSRIWLCLEERKQWFHQYFVTRIKYPDFFIFCIGGTQQDSCCRKVPRSRLPVPQICSGAKWSEKPKTLSLTTTAPLSHALSSSDRFKFTSDRRRHHHHRHRLVIVIVIWLMKNHISSQEFSKVDVDWVNWNQSEEFLLAISWPEIQILHQAS